MWLQAQAQIIKPEPWGQEGFSYLDGFIKKVENVRAVERQQRTDLERSYVSERERTDQTASHSSVKSRS